MRILSAIEMTQVAGGGCSCTCPPPPCEEKTKNNNGYGNGPESGPPPGHSGDHNPQLTTWNSGPKGPR
ncbi:MAG: hypothetical protein ACJ8DZ_09500 [Allosphingosinicella sp.]